MVRQNDIAVLSKALGSGLISVDQFAQFVRELVGDPGQSAELLLCKTGLSDDEVRSLISSTKPQLSDLTATLPPRAGSLDVTTDSPRRGPDGGTAAADVPTFSRGGAQTPSPAVAETPAEGQPAGPQQLTTQLRYQIGEEIGRGGLGRVVTARDLYVGRDVALKEMLPRPAERVDSIERFFVEAQVTGQLEHPGIAPVHAVGVSPEGKPFYIMKLIKGHTLAGIIREHHAAVRRGAARTAQRHQMLRVFVDVCNAVAFAHSHGVMHRDIKPSNIMVGDFGEALLVDWGLARVLKGGEAFQRQLEAAEQLQPSTASTAVPVSSSPKERSVTEEGTVLGTFAYMSPEQAQGATESLDQRADVFSLGATLYEILVGRPPYRGNRKELYEQALEARFPAPREVNPRVPRALEAVCLRAMAPKPDDRYQTARDLGEEVSRWQAGEPVQAYREPIWDRAVRWIRRHRTLCVSTAAAVLVLALAALAWQIHQGRQTRRVAKEARGLLDQGRQAFDARQLPDAEARLAQAATLLSTQPGLAELQTEVDWWQQKTRAASQALQAARTRLDDFRRLRDEAVFHGMLATGVDIEQNVERAKQAAEEALGLFSLRPETGDTPPMDPEVYTSQEAAEVVQACRQLRCTYADAVAQPLPGRSRQQNRAAAKRALALLDQTGARDASPKSYYLRRGLYAHLAGDDPGAREAMHRAEAQTARTAEDHFLVGDYQYRSGQYEAAAGSFRQALQLAPDHFWADYFLGASLAQLGEWQDAIAALTSAADQRRDFAHTYLLRGFAHGELGDLDVARADFERAEQAGIARYSLLLNRGVLSLRHGKLKAAIEDFQQATAAEPDSPQAYLSLAEAYRVQSRLDEAMKVLDQAAAAAPHSARVHHLRAQVLVELGNEKGAVAELDQGINKADRGIRLRADLFLERGRLRHRQALQATDAKARAQGLEAALEDYDQALREHDECYEARCLRGLALAELRRDREAVDAFDRYLAESPLRLAVYAPVDAVAPGAVVVPGQAAARADQDPKRMLAIVYRERGLARIRLGDSAGAVRDFMQAEELAASLGEFPLTYDRERFGVMFSRCGWAFLRAGQELALKEFDAHIRIAPDNPEPYTGRGHARALLGDYRRAIEDADTATRLGSENPGMYFNAAGVYAECHGLAKADTQAEDAPAVAETCHRRAIECLKECFEKSPESREFYLDQTRRDRAFDPIRDSQEFQELLKSYSP